MLGARNSRSTYIGHPARRSGPSSRGRNSRRPRVEELEPYVLLSMTFTVTSSTGYPNSLAAAINAVDADGTDTAASPDQIDFAIGGGGSPQTIATGDLPDLTSPATIDGTTQDPGLGTPAITLDGSGASFGNGLKLDPGAGGSTLRGLAILNFDGDGLFIYGSNNTIGGTAAGAGDVISGNDGDAVFMFTDLSNGNVLEGNRIGTNAAGTAALPNGGDGVFIEGSNNTVGGTAVGAGNVISGNDNGVFIFSGQSTGNVVEGNRIGTDAAGTAAVPNQSSGVFIGGDDNTVGGTTPAARNVISGNDFNGVFIVGSPGGTGNVVEGNYIGTDFTGTKGLGNEGDGVFLFGATANAIGGAAAGAGNVISANMLHGVNIAEVSGNDVEGNIIGFDVTDTISLPNLLGNGVVMNIIDDVNGQLNIKLSGISHNPFSRLYSQQITLTNNSAATIASQIDVILTGLTPGVELYSATDIHGNAYLTSTDHDGNPYIVLGQSLVPGQSVTIDLNFLKASSGLYISYTPAVYWGPSSPDARAGGT